MEEVIKQINHILNLPNKCLLDAFPLLTLNSYIVQSTLKYEKGYSNRYEIEVENTMTGEEETIYIDVNKDNVFLECGIFD